MVSSIHIQHCAQKDCFRIHFQAAQIELCINELIEILMVINKRDEVIFELSLLHSLKQLDSSILRKNAEYQLFFGRVYCLLNQVEIVQFLSLLWKNHPMLMQWVFTQQDAKHTIPSLSLVSPMGDSEATICEESKIGKEIR